MFSEIDNITPLDGITNTTKCAWFSSPLPKNICHSLFLLISSVILLFISFIELCYIITFFIVVALIFYNLLTIYAEVVAFVAGSLEAGGLPGSHKIPEVLK